MKGDFGEKLGTCEICNINLWSSTDGKPAIWPCNVTACPYENPLTQNQHVSMDNFSPTGSGLGQIDFQEK